MALNGFILNFKWNEKTLYDQKFVFSLVVFVQTRHFRFDVYCVFDFLTKFVC